MPWAAGGTLDVNGQSWPNDHFRARGAPQTNACEFFFFTEMRRAAEDAIKINDKGGQEPNTGHEGDEGI
jgi:hypothetical protein